MPSHFLYARKSSEDDDRQVASIPAQLDELRRLAEARGIVISRLFEESQSARAPGRPVFTAMMRELDRHPAAGILCWKPDRLARNALDGGRVIDALDRHRVAEIVSPGRTFRNTGDDKFMLSIEFGVSKKYVDDRARATHRASRSRQAARTACPAGANPKPTAKKPLNKRKSRADSAARTVSLSRWWTVRDSNPRPPPCKGGALAS